jgi:hypothetical protein
MYAYLCSLEGRDVVGLYVIAWWKGWTPKDMMGNPKYPRKPVEQVRMKLWTRDEQEDYLYTRLGIMMDDENKQDEDLTPCTTEDMWSRGESWAVFKYPKGKKMKKAARVLYSEEDAKRWIKKMVKAPMVAKIEHRPAQRLRCDEWCEVTDWCNQYQEYKKKGKK